MHDSSFDEFYVGTRRNVYAQVLGIVGDGQDAQEITQEAYVRAWSNWEKIRKYEDPVGWVRGVAWRLAISRWRRTKSRARILLRPAEQIADVQDASVDRLVVHEALSSLSQDARAVVVLFYLADLSIEEIARQTGMRPGTIKSHLARSRASLADRLSSSPTGNPESRQIGGNSGSF